MLGPAVSLMAAMRATWMRKRLSWPTRSSAKTCDRNIIAGERDVAQGAEDFNMDDMRAQPIRAFAKLAHSKKVSLCPGGIISFRAVSRGAGAH